MAKFNEKVLCLFNKDYKQLKKEAERRGMCYDSREKTIAKIIWKDAYDAGVIDGRGLAPAGNTFRNCPVGCCGNAKPQTHEYSLLDICENFKYKMSLTDDQVRLMEWLADKGMLIEHEFEDWCETYEDVGEI